VRLFPLLFAFCWKVTARCSFRPPTRSSRLRPSSVPRTARTRALPVRTSVATSQSTSTRRDLLLRPRSSLLSTGPVRFLPLLSLHASVLPPSSECTSSSLRSLPQTKAASRTPSPPVPSSMAFRLLTGTSRLASTTRRTPGSTMRVSSTAANAVRPPSLLLFPLLSLHRLLTFSSFFLLSQGARTRSPRLGLLLTPNSARWCATATTDSPAAATTLLTFTRRPGPSRPSSLPRPSRPPLLPSRTSSPVLLGSVRLSSPFSSYHLLSLTLFDLPRRRLLHRLRERTHSRPGLLLLQVGRYNLPRFRQGRRSSLRRHYLRRRMLFVASFSLSSSLFVTDPVCILQGARTRSSSPPPSRTPTSACGLATTTRPSSAAALLASTSTATSTGSRLRVPDPRSLLRLPLSSRTTLPTPVRLLFSPVSSLT
jgi:hypothetical protein